MAAINKGIVTSFGNTPQAVDDVFNATELGIGSSGSYAPILIDVMANDKAGGAKTLYSLDDGTSEGGIRPTDLLTQDTARSAAASTDTSASGAKIWITADGQVGYDASTLSSAALAQIQGLGAGQYFTDTFTYAIRMANGTLSWATAQIKIAGVNDAATITGTSTGSTVEDTPGQLHAQGTLTVNDLDVGQNVFQAPPATSLDGTYGTFTFNALTGDWTYDLDHAKADHLYGGQVVHDTLVVTSLDGTASRTIDITVTGTNDAPVAVNDTNSGDEDGGAIAGSVAGNDSDVDVGGSLTYILVDGVDPSEGVLTFNDNGTYSFVPAANFNGQVTFTYQANDGSANSNVATVTITVDPVTDLAAEDDSFTVNEDGTLSASVATNDTTISGGTLSYAVDTDVSNGTLTLNADGSFSYEPDANYHGADSFTYTVTDAASGESDTRTVSITVDPVTDLAAEDDSFTVNEDGTLSASVATNDTTISGGTLSYAVDTDVSNGTLTLNADGSFSYEPDANYHGADSFTYTVTDAASGESDTRTVSITVDPVTDLAAEDDSFTVNEDGTLSASVATNDTTISGGTLSYAVDTDVSNGTLTLNADGSFSYEPDANYHGADSFTYTVTDAASGESDTRTVSITVDPVTDLAAEDDSFTVNEDGTLSASVATNDTTISGGTLSYAVDTDVSNGTLTLNADGSFSYEPDANYHGADSFTYTVTDAASGESDTRTVSITVDPVTDLAAEDDSFTVNEDGTLSASVATNDTTISGGTLSYAVDTDVSNGTLTLNADGSFSYEPDANYHGADSFTYTVTDAASGESDTRTVSITVDPVTDLAAEDDSFTVNEDGTLSASVATNDTTISGGTLSYAVDTDVSNGTLTLNADGSFSYEPDANYHGADSFTYTVTDAASGESDTRTVSITVDPVTDLAAEDDSFTVNEDGTLSASVATNDTTISGGTLSYAVDTDVSNGTLTLNADGSFSYEPDANYHGADSFTYTVTDAASGESDTRTVSITVDPVTDLAAEDDSFTVNEDGTLSASVATNDTTISGGTLSYAVDTDVSNGTLTLNADGSFSYEPDANYHGADSFTYTVTDAASGESDTRTVSITVDPVTDLAAEDDSFTVNEDGTLSASVATNDTTISGGTLSYAVDTDVSNGTLTLNADGSFSYEPDANYHGADSFTYTVTDAASGESDTRTVSITVDPVTDLAAEDDSFTVNEDGTLSASVATNDTTISGGTLSYVVDTDVSNGTLTLNGDGSFSYEPDANYHGADSFTYTVTDAASGESDTRTVSITVDPVTDLAAEDDSFTVNEDGTLSASVATNDTTISGGTLSYVVDTDVSNGTLTLNGDGSFSYEPDANYHGADSFTYTVTDAASGESDTRTVSITVDPVTDLAAEDDSFTVNEDGTLSASVATNDTTISGGTLSYAVDTDVSNGTLTLNADGSFSYEPDANYHGADSFTYTVTDAASGESDTRTVSITVDPVTDLAAEDDSFTVNEDGTLSASVATNDTTISGGTLSYAVDTDVSNGTLTLNADGSFSYEPDANYHGADSFTYTVTDAASGESDTRTVSITVDPVTDLAAEDDSFTVNEDGTLSASVATNDTTISGGTLSYAVDTDVSNGTLTLNADGSFSYEPDANYHGADSFTYTVTDAASGESDTRTVSITVDPVTDLAAEDDSFTVNEDGTLSASVATNDTTISGGTLSYAVDTDVSNGTLTLNADGSFSYEPDANYHGADSFTYTVTDAASGESDTRTVSITVDPVTDLAAEDDSFTVNEDGTLSASVATNDTTISGGTLSYAVDTDVSNGTLTLNADGSFSYEPDANYHGADSFTYTVTDAASGESDTRTVSITVDPVTDLAAEDDSFTVNEDGTLSASVATNDTTISGGTLSYAVDTDVSNGTLTLNADGSFSYEPDANYHGADSFTYTVTDAASGESDTRTVSITVDPVTDLAAEDDSFTVNEDGTLSASVATNDTTISGGTLSYAVDTDVSNGTLTLNADGSFSYEPDANYHGADSFTYTVTDAASGESDTRTVSITVDPVTDLAAEDDSFTVNEDGTLSASVATNDTTISGGTLSYAVDTDVSNGTLTLNADGSFSYEPDANYHGADSFTYTVTDAASGESDTRTVSITVDPVTDLAAEDDSFTVNEDGTLSASVATNDTTISGGTLSYAVDTDVSNGTLTLNADGSFSYEPDANYHGADSFTYTVTDAASGESDTRTVSITVDPVTDLAAEDDSFTVNEDGTLSASVATNDTTISGGTLSYAVDTDVSNGTLTLNADGSFSYEPDANYHGADSFTYTVTDAASGESDTRTVSITVDPVTDLAAEDDSFTVNEDGTLSASVATNDTTISGGTLSYAVDTDVSNGTLTLNADGSFSYEPDANYHGADSFTYTVTDAASGESDTRTVSITVDPVTDLAAEDDSFTVNEDGTLSASVATNDTTISGGTLSYAVDTDVSNGTLTLNADGSFSYEPDANYHGADSFTYTVTDAASGESDTRTVSITVDPVTDLAAEDDSFTVNEDGTLSASVATNDTTISGGTLSYAVDTDVSNGTLTLNADGSFSYEPDANYHGADSFTYTVTDAASGESDTRTVSITVDPVTDLAAEDDSFTVNEDGTLSASVATNDTTISGGTLSYAVDTDVSNGTLTLNADGSFSYEPDANYHGADSFTYTVTDAASGESDTRTVSITVDPVTDLAAEDDSFTVNEDGTLSASVATNDTTISGGTLSYAVDTDVSNGTLTLNADGSFSYEPDANYHGADSFTYTVTDAASGESDTRTVSITVDPVTDLAAEDDSFTVNEDGTLSASVATNDTTISGGTLSYAVDTDVSNGTLTLNADGSFSYEPDANYHGADSFTYTVTDAASGESDTRTVSITVDPVTDLAAEDDSFTVNEDGTLSASVATNDTTISGGTLSYAVDTDVSNGTLTLNADGSFSYEPDANYHGADSFTYTVTDAASGESDTRTVSITVDPVTDLAAEDDSFTVNEDGTLSASVATNDTTISGGTLSYAVDTDVSNGTLTLNADGSFSYEPDANYHGADSFTYTVTDAASGESDTRTVSITVDPVTDLAAEDDSFTVNEDGTLSASVATNDTTISGGTLSYAVDTDVSNGTLTLNADGSFSYEPDANYHGADSFTYTVTDAASGESDTRTVSITVDPVTDLAAEDDSFTVNEDGTLSASVATNDTTISGGTLSYAVDTDVSNGTLTLNADGSFSYEPDANYHGADSFTYTVTDAASGESDTRTVSITVDPVTDLAAEDDSFTVNEDGTLSASVATNDTTISGGTLSYAVDTDVSNGTLTLNADGSFSYEPDANYHGADSFTYTVTDAASGESDTRTVSITVDPVTDLAAEDDSFTVNEDGTLSASVATNDTTISGGTLSYAVDTDVSNGTLTLNADGSFSYEPDANYHGADSFTYTVTDAASGESDTRTVSITVDPVTDLAAEDDSFTVNEDGTLSASVATNDTTISGGTLSYAVDTDVSNGTLTLNADGSFSYEPDANYHGADSFTYTVTDAASGESDTRTVSITVDPVTDLAAEDDSFTVNEDGTLSASVATNDTTISGGTLSYAVDTDVSNGTLTLNADGSFSYEPDANYHGADSFTYTVTDAASGESDTRTVSITVDPVTDLAAEDDSFTVNEDGTLSASVATNDTTISGGTLSYAVDTDVSNGTLTLNADGSFSYEPDANYHGADSFTYTVTDAASGESDTRTVSITVDPVTDLAAEDDSFTVNEDGTLSASVATNDTTISGGTLSYAVDTDVSNGTLTLNADGSFSYEPDANYHGADSFTYTVTDAASGESDTRTVSITVDPVNDAPTLDLDASAAGTGYAATSAAGAATAIVDSDVAITDVDNTQLSSATITISNHKTGDVLSIVGSLPVGITASSYNSGTGVLTLNGAGTLAQYQSALQQLRFSNGESHPDITDRDITVTVSDGLASSNTAHATISVTASNEPPAANDDSFTVTEDGISGGTLAARLAVGNVLTNAPADSDPDGDGLSVTSVTSVTVTETDAQLSTPVITSETAGVGEAARYQIQTSTGVAHLAVMATGAVTLWTTAGDAFQGLGTTESATLSFIYEISDGHGGTDTATAQITINGSNDTPTASNVVQAVADTLATNAGTVVASGNLVTASAAADPDGDTPLTISSIQGPSDGSAIPVTAGGVVAHGTYGDLTVSSNGTYSYTAKPTLDALQTGNNPTEAFSFVVSDGHGGTTINTLTFNISGANDTPTGFNFQLLSTALSTGDTGNNGLNASTAIGTFLPTGDPDSSVFTFSFLGVPPAGFAINPTTGVLSTNATVAVSPTAYSLTVVASDGVNSFSTPLKIWVLGTGADTANGAADDIDIMYGANGNDTLNGNGGSDAIIGGSQNDTIFGGLGADQLVGGSGNDTFIYTAVNESGVGAGNRDTIFDFANGDKIDLSAIDANTNTAGNGTFVFVAAATASIVNNSVTWHQAGGNTYIHGDNNGDGIADFEIELLGARTMVIGDFVL